MIGLIILMVGVLCRSRGGLDNMMTMVMIGMMIGDNHRLGYRRLGGVLGSKVRECGGRGRLRRIGFR